MRRGAYSMTGIEERTEELLGKVVVFEYPHANDRNVRRKRWERRIVHVERVRDQAAEPITQEAIAANPDLERSGPLVTGLDLGIGKERSFYLGAMRGLRVGLREHEVQAMQHAEAVRVFIDDAHGARVASVPDARRQFIRSYQAANPKALIITVGG